MTTLNFYENVQLLILYAYHPMINAYLSFIVYLEEGQSQRFYDPWIHVEFQQFFGIEIEIQKRNELFLPITPWKYLFWLHYRWQTH